MSRSERLFDLLQVLRRHKRPVSGQILAQETGVSIRTLYRDISSLQALGAMIEGEAGVGYILKPGFLLPPLMFTSDEIEALILGTRWVIENGDQHISDAARNTLTRIAAVLPSELREELEKSTLLVGPSNLQAPDSVDLKQLRKAIRSEYKLSLQYRDLSNNLSTRTIWPFALSYFNDVRVLLGWCELRQGFRHFRTDRIIAANILEKHYPERRQHLLKRWRDAEGITRQFD